MAGCGLDHRRRSAAWLAGLIAQRGVRAGAVLVFFGLAGCAGSESGPLVQCAAADSRGQRWIARDLNPLAAQERALVDCGAESADPDSCVAVSCDRQW